ncbi:MAG: hypothetical protein ACR2RE_14675 [Geminicoccaceae bacterium]
MTNQKSPSKAHFFQFNIGIKNGQIPLLVLPFGFGVLVISLASIVAFSMGGHWDLLKLGEESNISTWFSSIQLSMIGLVLATIAMRDIDPKRLPTWSIGLVPFFFLFLSLDEVAMLHERLGDWVQANSGLGADMRTGPWMFIFAPLTGMLALAAAATFWPYLRNRNDALALFLSGLAVLAFSAVGLEFSANFVQDDSLVLKALGFLEECGEMAAGTLMLWGALIVVRAEGIKLDLGRSKSHAR